METSHKARVSPRDFFLYLGVIVALYIVVISVLRLWFEIINTAFPDVLEYQYRAGFDDESLRAAIAALFVVFPIHLYLARLWNSAMRKDKEKQHVWVRKWFLYVTLFVAGVTLAVDLIILIDHFLGGELSTRFFFKVAAVFAAAGSVFWYFIYDLKRDVSRADKRLKLFALGAASLLLASVVGGFIIIGSPHEARLRRFDETRVNNLVELQWRIIGFWQERRVLPQNFDGVIDYGVGPYLDPETNKPYEYQVLGEYSFELCAEFARASKTGDGKRLARESSIPIMVPMIKVGSMPESWEHDAGKYCFKREIDPNVYPPISPSSGIRVQKL